MRGMFSQSQLFMRSRHTVVKSVGVHGFLVDFAAKLILRVWLWMALSTFAPCWWEVGLAWK